MLSDQKELVKVSDRLFKFDLNEEQQALAFRIKITSLMRLHATSDRKAREQLMELTKEYIDSENEEISIFCYAGELNLKTQDYLRLESSDFAPLRDLVDTTTGKFPESVKIANECLAVIVQLLSQDKRDDAIELMKICLLYTSPSPRDATLSRMPSSA